jgi:predicted ATPase
VAGLECEFLPPKTLESRKTNLPVQPTPLVGRERELDEVLALLRRDGVRLLTLTGPGGTGKTRLALQAAAELLDEFSAGVWFINLAPLTEPELVVPTVAQTLGVREQAGETLMDTIAADLAGKEGLLLLDNFEQVVEAAPALAELLASVATLQLLVTSRAPLHLSGEHEYAVPPLTAEEALALFAERAAAVKASFLLDGNRPLVAEICRRLDHLPLAIELAAARIKLLPEEALLERLDECLKLLTGGPRDLDLRQRTLRAAIDWSYDLLSLEEQLLFRRLAVFAGGATLEAIDAVCNPKRETDVLDRLAALVDHSLLRQQETDGKPRFVMLETIREYARERLEESGEGEELRKRHAASFSEFAFDGDPRLRTREQTTWIDQFEQEHNNLRAALTFLAGQDEPEPQAQLAGACCYFWYLTGRYAERLERLSAAFERSDAIDPGTRASLHEGLTIMYSMLGRMTEAAAQAQASLRIRRLQAEPRQLLRSLSNSAFVAQITDDLETAEQLLTECADLARDVGDDWYLALSLTNLAVNSFVTKDFERARELGKQALAHAEELDPQLRVSVAANVASADLELGNVDVARELFLEILRGRDARVPEPLVWALDGLAAAEARIGNYDRAACLLGATESVAAEIGYALLPMEQLRHERTHAELSERLGDRLAAQHSAGRGMDLEMAIAFALEGSSGGASPG